MAVLLPRTAVPRGGRCRRSWCRRRIAARGPAAPPRSATPAPGTPHLSGEEGGGGRGRRGNGIGRKKRGGGGPLTYDQYFCLENESPFMVRAADPRLGISPLLNPDLVPTTTISPRHTDEEEAPDAREGLEEGEGGEVGAVGGLHPLAAAGGRRPASDDANQVNLTRPKNQTFWRRRGPWIKPCTIRKLLGVFKKIVPNHRPPTNSKLSEGNGPRAVPK